MVLRNIDGKAARSAGKADEEMAHGEESMSRVVQAQSPVELRALAAGVGLGVREDKEVGDFIDWEC